MRKEVQGLRECGLGVEAFRHATFKRVCSIKQIATIINHYKSRH